VKNPTKTVKEHA